MTTPGTATSKCIGTGSTLAAFPFRSQVRTRFDDLDSRRHVNNVAMGVLFQEGRLDFHRALFESVARPDGYGFVVAQVSYRFVGETFYPGAVEIGLGVSRIGKTSFGYSQGMFQDGRCTSRCDTVLVGLVERKPVAVPAPLAAALAGFLLGEARPEFSEDTQAGG